MTFVCAFGYGFAKSMLGLRNSGAGIEGALVYMESRSFLDWVCLKCNRQNVSDTWRCRTCRVLRGLGKPVTYPNFII